MPTYRERAFLRSTRYLHSDSSLHVFSKVTQSFWLGQLDEPGLRELIELAQKDEKINYILSQMPISQQRAGTYYDPELHPGLQDLADLITFEADDAAIAEYYPRLPQVDVSDEHVIIVMEAMQREIDRESSHRGPAVQLREMPWERQCSLAERRRYWYGFFGITPESWPTGLWSIWGVPDEDIPADLLARLEANPVPNWFYPGVNYPYGT